jgi:hypothetical protein
VPWLPACGERGSIHEPSGRKPLWFGDCNGEPGWRTLAGQAVQAFPIQLRHNSPYSFLAILNRLTYQKIREYGVCPEAEYYPISGVHSMVRATPRREQARELKRRGVLAAQRLEPSMEPTPPAAASPHLVATRQLGGLSATRGGRLIRCAVGPHISSYKSGNTNNSKEAGRQ